MSDEMIRAIGKLEGRLDSMHETSKANSDKLDAIDKRLRAVETRSATYGTVGGALAGVGISLLVAKLKGITGTGP
ncbi:hypothetical protein [Thiothrix nivea]|uniref:Uncharacterized protein n=1 Tax=Thiothrix nivea (strain ATCC 35100 / DSM 5205 / JP2) TaxID=870187 RepID=A0A656HB72_THINJ|nr:hypothetical protein [Thiothrix nivea]EIJ33352.1 hypothetical protein Thini_0715 [Thiothrix nivea DSM 5205]